ncbi:Hypothetical predicted protein [Cloeon dipterum]|uniref:Peptidase S1 domain-containing protein n=1 Tax=Cloeon dipterum TaxID=197152 RepID=A0A8S1CYX2_9INSE|nr:Hypothetical predicted protein [Cloeon dipterum]
MGLANVFTALALTVVVSVDAANGPIRPIDRSMYPYLAMVTLIDDSQITPGVFISEKYVLTNGDVVQPATESAILVSAGNGDEVFQVIDVTTEYDKWVSVLELNGTYNGPVLSLLSTKNKPFDFRHSQPGDMLFLHENGTLFGQSTDVLNSNLCPDALRESGEEAAAEDFNTTVQSCNKFDPSDCSFHYNQAEKLERHAVLAVDGVVSGFVSNLNCDYGEDNTNLYDAPQIFTNIGVYSEWIMENAGMIKK